MRGVDGSLSDVVFIFEVHQPYRIKQSFFWDQQVFKRLSKGELFDHYFDTTLDREIFMRISRKCYLPTNEIILKAIDESKFEKKRVKISFSLSGIFLEQCEKFNKDVLESFKQLAETDCVEFVGQTYYHSLSGLYREKNEFIEQVQKHKQVIRDFLGKNPLVFENTELLYNNTIAETVEKLGYLGIVIEGVERILGGRSPNYVYVAKNCRKLKVLLRNYKLTDDIGFRFSARWWNEWPLTADKYASWLASTQGHCIVIFPDYETFGEHHWPETGIQDFLYHLLKELTSRNGLTMATPSEVVQKNEPIGVIDVPELEGTISWGDIRRDSSCWIGNTMQWAYYKTIRDMEPLIKESLDPELTKLWRYFQISDHLYYMYTGGGGPGEVHTYFSPFSGPVDAFISSLSEAIDFEKRVRAFSMASNEPFKFYTGVGEDNYTGLNALSLIGLIKILEKIDIKAIEFHNNRRDFEEWASLSLRNKKLAKKLRSVSKYKGKLLREKLLQITNKHLMNYYKTWIG